MIGVIRRNWITWFMWSHVELFGGICHVYCSLSSFLEAFLTHCMPKSPRMSDMQRRPICNGPSEYFSYSPLSMASIATSAHCLFRCHTFGWELKMPCHFQFSLAKLSKSNITSSKMPYWESRCSIVYWWNRWDCLHNPGYNHIPAYQYHIHQVIHYLSI